MRAARRDAVRTDVEQGAKFRPGAPLRLAVIVFCLAVWGGLAYYFFG